MARLGWRYAEPLLRTSNARRKSIATTVGKSRSLPMMKFGLFEAVDSGTNVESSELEAAAYVLRLVSAQTTNTNPKRPEASHQCPCEAAAPIRPPTPPVQ